MERTFTTGKKKIGTELFNSPRGHYIISQALVKAIMKMMEVRPVVDRETSNIEDMEILHETLFPDYEPRLVK